MNVPRWNELKRLEKEDPEKLKKIGRELGLSDDMCIPLHIMARENERDYPEKIKNIRDWIK